MNNSNKFRVTKIQNNTDAQDIREKKIGLDVQYDGETSDLQINRGLHIQITHNRDDLIFDAGVKVARLISAAPEMLEALEALVKGPSDIVIKSPDDSAYKALILAERAIRKARGES